MQARPAPASGGDSGIEAGCKRFNRMTLQDFVRDSLIQVTSGVDEARVKNRKIAPWVQAESDKKCSGFTIHDGTPAFLVEFDVAVSVSTKKDGSGGASISIAHVFTAGGGAEASKEHSEVSRIRFSVPINFTNMAEGAKDIAKENAG